MRAHEPRARASRAEPGRGALPLARRRRVAHRGIDGRRVRARADAADRLARGAEELRRAVGRVPPGAGVPADVRDDRVAVVPAPPVPPPLRARGPGDRRVEPGAAVPRAAVRVPAEVPRLLAVPDVPPGPDAPA